MSNSDLTCRCAWFWCNALRCIVLAVPKFKQVLMLRRGSTILTGSRRRKTCTNKHTWLGIGYAVEQYQVEVKSRCLVRPRFLFGPILPYQRHILIWCRVIHSATPLQRKNFCVQSSSLPSKNKFSSFERHGSIRGWRGIDLKMSALIAGQTTSVRVTSLF